MSEGRRARGLRDFFLLYIGQTLSQLGSSMTAFATVIWAYTENGEVLASSLLAICSTVPYLIVSLLGGAVVDRGSKKKIMLICDTAAALGSAAILACFWAGCLELWILCLCNVVGGFMNAFQTPASQVAVTLLVEEKDYARVGGIQSVAGAAVGILTPTLAAALLSIGGLGLILWVDLGTFLFAFLTLLLLIRIPEKEAREKDAGFRSLRRDMVEGFSFLKGERGILLMLLMYGILEFTGAISFDSMYSPMLLARTGNDEMAVGLVSSCMAAGCMAASLLLSMKKQPEHRLRAMFFGSFLCLFGITLFGMGRSLLWWCVVAFCGCFGSPIYSTYQTVLLRERVPVAMQGRIFSIQGLLTQMLTPVGYLLGAILADHILEPFMARQGSAQSILARLVGSGKGAGMGLLFVGAGILGMVLLAVLGRNPQIRNLEAQTAKSTEP